MTDNLTRLLGAKKVAELAATPLQNAAANLLRCASMYDSEALRYSVGIDLLKNLEYALADEQGRERRKLWTFGER